MGQAIEAIAKSRGHEIVACVDAGDSLTILESANPDVAIEFTRPDAAPANLKFCAVNGIPVVCGTTAWYDDYASVKDAFVANNGALFTATNYSVGVNLFWEACRKLSELMLPHSEYKPSVHEVHHTAKLDAPSGTAITTAEVLLGSFINLTNWEHSATPAENALGITHDRIDNVPGTHTVTFKSAVDEISITHEAYSRQGFATGAVIAAEWLKDKKGIFGMKDLLGFGAVTK